MKRRERVALLLSPDLREVARHVQTAREQLGQVDVAALDDASAAKVLSAVTATDEALDLLLGRGRR